MVKFLTLISFSCCCIANLRKKLRLNQLWYITTLLCEYISNEKTLCEVTRLRILFITCCHDYESEISINSCM